MTTTLMLLLLVCLLICVSVTQAWAPLSQKNHQQVQQMPPTPKRMPIASSRRDMLQQSTTTALIAAATATAFQPPQPAMAVTDSITLRQQKEKSLNLPNAELQQRIRSDLEDKQFLVTGNISRELYDESATFTDEIDTYGLEQWMKGTSTLFVAAKSHVDLEDGSLQVSDKAVTFRFSEYLCFNIPLLLPTVYLSGKVILERSPTTGLITSYKEQWDQDVNTVLKSAKLFS